MAVVVQRMVFPQAAGVLFTADPVTSNRKVTAVEAGFGLGESLVSGHVNPDVFKVRDGVVIARAVATKEPAQRASRLSPGSAKRGVPHTDPRRQRDLFFIRAGRQRRAPRIDLSPKPPDPDPSQWPPATDAAGHYGPASPRNTTIARPNLTRSSSASRPIR